MLPKVVIAVTAAAVLAGGALTVKLLAGDEPSTTAVLTAPEPTASSDLSAATPAPTPSPTATPGVTSARPAASPSPPVASVPVPTAVPVLSLAPVLPSPTRREMTPAEYDESLGYTGFPESCRQARLGEGCYHPGTRGSGGTGVPRGRELVGDDLTFWWDSNDVGGNDQVAPIREFYVLIVDGGFTRAVVAKRLPRTARTFTAHDLPPGTYNSCLQELNATGLGVAECEGHPVTIQPSTSPTPTSTSVP